MEKKVLAAIKKIKPVKVSWVLFIIYAAMALAMTLLILNWDKNSTKIENIFVFLVKLTPFILGLLAIGCFPAEALPRVLRIVLILLDFACMFCFFVPRLFRFFHITNWDQYYLLTQVYVPFIILSLTLAYKLGGGKTKEVMVFGISGILLMVSGIEDLCYFVMNGLPVPEIWDWPQHMIVRFGKIPTKIEALIFIGVHFLLIMLIFFLAYSKFSPFLRMRKKDDVNIDQPG